MIKSTIYVISKFLKSGMKVSALFCLSSLTEDSGSSKLTLKTADVPSVIVTCERRALEKRGNFVVIYVISCRTVTSNTVLCVICP